MKRKKTVMELIPYSVINLDKPRGITSRQVVTEIKKFFGLKRCGHTGTLDTNVTGLLIVALEDATKVMPVLMGLGKEYEGIIYLHKDVDEKKLGEVISENFVGTITQIPPVKSRVARIRRKRIVYSFDILEKKDKNVRFRTKVQAGTYIRKLCSDIGEKLDVGAHMKELRRIKVGHFSLKDSHSLDEVKKVSEEFKQGNDKALKKILIPIEKAIPHVKKIYVKESSLKSIFNGAPIRKSDTVKIQGGIETKEIVGIFSLKDQLIALGIAKTNSKNMKRSRGTIVRIDRIIHKFKL